VDDVFDGKGSESRSYLRIRASCSLVPTYLSTTRGASPFKYPRPPQTTSLTPPPPSRGQTPELPTHRYHPNRRSFRGCPLSPIAVRNSCTGSLEEKRSRAAWRRQNRCGLQSPTGSPRAASQGAAPSPRELQGEGEATSAFLLRAPPSTARSEGTVSPPAGCESILDKTITEPFPSQPRHGVTGRVNVTVMVDTCFTQG
jgi:hypothetical protein